MEIENNRSSDFFTIIALSVIAYSGASLIHEAFGHGIASLLVGIAPKGLTSISLDVDWANVSAEKVIFIGAAGTIANLVAGFVFLWLLQKSARKDISSSWRYFLWLSMTINFLHGAGYLPMVWFFGDWKYVVEAGGLEPQIIWKIGLTIVGTAIYFVFGMWLAGRYLEPFLGQDAPTRISRAQRLTWVPYLVGSSVLCAAALFHPNGSGMAALAAAEWFGGTSLLFFLPFVVEKPKPYSQTPLRIGQSYKWIIVGCLILVAFIVVLGPGVTFTR